MIKALKALLLMEQPYIRLAVRAVVVGVGVAVATVQESSDPLDKGVWMGAIAAGGFAALEIFTPLNRLVGWFKKTQ
jgi:hypothetical protein